ncbi:MAG: M50 family metallopeptidase [Solirubrobacterales bacterium]
MSVLASVFQIASDAVPWLLVLAGFCALIILHEFGHFIAAKRTGMRVERFFLFFPPKLFSVRRGETEYGIGMIPAGGFVKITGMNPEELEAAERGEHLHKPGILEQIEGADSSSETPAAVEGSASLPPEVLKRAYYNQPVWKRIVVIGAGPAMNVLIAFLVLFFLALGLQRATALQIGSIEKDKPAQGVLQSGDQIISVDGVRPAQGGSRPSAQDLSDRADAIARQVNTHTCAGTPGNGCRATTPAVFVVRRDGKPVTVKLIPFYDANAPSLKEGGPVGRYRVGFGFGEGGFVPENLSVPAAAGRSISFMWDVTSKTISTFARIFEPQQRKQLSGVVGVSDVAHQTIQFGAREALTLLAVISLSLAIINLFPFLPLDGGHIFWSLVEKVRGSRVPFSVIERASAVGFLLILMLFVIGLTNDIGRLSGSGFHVR